MQQRETKKQLTEVEQLIAHDRHKKARKLLLYIEDPAADEMLEQVDDVLNSNQDKWEKRQTQKGKIPQQQKQPLLHRIIDRPTIVLTVIISCWYLSAIWLKLRVDIEIPLVDLTVIAPGFLNYALLYPLQYHPVAMVIASFLLSILLRQAYKSHIYLLGLLLIVLTANAWLFYTTTGLRY
jgi:hypothetical protein